MPQLYPQTAYPASESGTEVEKAREILALADA